MNLSDVMHLINGSAQEGLQLEFKRGESLGSTNRQKGELVKDVSGFANGGGGTIIYGIAEKKTTSGATVAACLAPVTDPMITKDWLTQVLRSQSQPPLQSFEIQDIALPPDEGGPDGRVIVISIEPSSTAHQSLDDHKYYLRAGVTTTPMVDFQIRDVMSRRSRPIIDVQLDSKRSPSPILGRHKFLIIPCFYNRGAVSLEKWRFEVDLPQYAFECGMGNMLALAANHFASREIINGGNINLMRIGFADPFCNGSPAVVHPGRRFYLDPRCGLPSLFLQVREDDLDGLIAVKPPLKWRLYLHDAPPLDGEKSFADWCDL
ncbi:MAG: helix-turn-helix domain-containing protein [Methylophilaceae bacterium]